jgi:hypothetical protein
MRNSENATLDGGGCEAASVSTKTVPREICIRRCKMGIGHAMALRWLDKALWIRAYQLARPSMSHITISSSLSEVSSPRCAATV